MNVLTAIGNVFTDCFNKVYTLLSNLYFGEPGTPFAFSLWDALLALWCFGAAVGAISLLIQRPIHSPSFRELHDVNKSDTELADRYNSINIKANTK